MKIARYSVRCESDLHEIAHYTMRVWGEQQTNKYLTQLADRCDFLAANPDLGQSCEDLRPRLRKYLESSHWIFYEREQTGIFVARIFHTRRLMTRRALR